MNKGLLKKILFDLCGAFSVFPTRQTTQVEIEKLISKLAPVDCGKQLIRLGLKGDGGYLVPDDLDSIVACFFAWSKQYRRV